MAGEAPTTHNANAFHRSGRRGPLRPIGSALAQEKETLDAQERQLAQNKVAGGGRPKVSRWSPGSMTSMLTGRSASSMPNQPLRKALENDAQDSCASSRANRKNSSG